MFDVERTKVNNIESYGWPLVVTDKTQSEV